MPKSLRSQRHKRLLTALVEARKSGDLTQTELARKLGRPQSFVAKYEGGERRLDVLEFLEVAEILGCDPAKIIKKL